ncbi:hypothetical protein CBA19CS11_29390 [Caballeronia novacaledonica]|uniref:hypothetical protein n=1 Tax=Caballeronia novacaledonica TaxID=1544861 RepID=UPI001EE21ACA|nr:hypothetical protein [Caballeronia novacaledonica]GJH13038.1 hypothetical protein CBA19CS11_29390 [Caballeronia novacaledonica]
MTTTSNPVSIGTPLSEQAIRNVNFFNGRLVTSRDMSLTQAAQYEADARLGQGIGEGVVHGLEVSMDNALLRQLRIEPGLALSRAGQTLCLGAAQILALVPSAASAAPSTTGGFDRCGVLSGGNYVAGNGLYLLTLAPATVAEGKAAVLALEPGNPRCNTDAMVEAVQFRLLRVDQGLLAERSLDRNPIGAAAISKWRNEVAYACFGYPDLADAHRAMGVPAAPGLLDAIRPRGLSDCDVPLALVYLTASQGIVFVDRWSVRRHVASQPESPPWSAWLGQQLDALAHAQLAQFQEQLLDAPAAALAGLRAADWFSWLPPAGFLEATGPRQIDWAAFLADRKPARTVPLAPGDVRAVLAQALRRDAVALSPAGGAPRFRVYRIADEGPWFFLREAPNAPHAEEVWLDGARARLPGINNVQSAIDALRGLSCGELSLRPDSDIRALIGAVPAGSDLRLCFDAGNYDLKEPLLLQGFRHVIVHGAGKGSLLVCQSAESVLVFDTCASVTVTGVALRGGRPTSGKGKLDTGLRGALTVIEVPQVHIERVAARCESDAELRTGGIVVRQKIDTVPSGMAMVLRRAQAQVRICACEVLVGASQLGILCVDCDLNDIRDNCIAAATPGQPGQRGIVVAGSVATEVSVAHNVVDSFAQGIAVGLSRKETEKGEPLAVQRAIVSHNMVGVALSARDRKRNRFGLFVGNAESLLLEGNRVTAGNVMAREIETEAIRLSGLYGAHLAVRANHVNGLRVGITFTPLTPPKLQKECVWLFDANLGGRNGDVIRCTEDVRRLLRDHDNVSIE